MKNTLSIIFLMVMFFVGVICSQEKDEIKPIITSITGKIILKKECYLRVEGKNFDPDTVEVKVVGLYCEQGCTIDHGAILEFKGKITSELIEILPVKIDNPDTFKFIVVNRGDKIVESTPYEVEVK